MSDNFRQAVEKILSFHTCEYDGRVCSDMTLDKYKERPSCERCRLDLIMAEVEKLAAGMPKSHTEGVTDWEVGVQHGIQCQYNECQAFIRKELKG